MKHKFTFDIKIKNNKRIGRFVKLLLSSFQV